MSAARILHVFPSFALGGQQRRFCALANAFGDQFSHVIMALDGDTSAARLLAPSVSHVFSSFEFGKSGALSPRNLKAFQTALTTCAPDILFTYNWGAIEASIANRAGPRLAHIHFEDGFGPDETIDHQHFRRVIARRVVLGRSTTVVPSETLYRLAVKKWKLPKDKLEFIPNGIDLAKFSTSAGQTENSTFPVIVGSVGALRPEKNYPRLVRVFAKAREAIGDTTSRLVIFGDGPARETIQDASDRCGVARFVDLPGETGAPEEAYRGFSIFALSSDTEQMPLSLIEAMASGLPAQCTNVGDIAQMVASGNGKYIVSPDNEGALAMRLAELMGDASLRKSIGQANSEKAHADYAFETMLRRHDALYTAKIAEGAGR